MARAMQRKLGNAFKVLSPTTIKGRIRSRMPKMIIVELEAYGTSGQP